MNTANPYPVKYRMISSVPPLSDSFNDGMVFPISLLILVLILKQGMEHALGTNF
jgi:hypothetical protein